ncbi:uncharacterized protein N7515_009125 [Penicillium bovifimosum]|uniref:Uncharacterized protein n=1 Tax=Penicillium bovifimosum TaxID=126998 RepID=A0A9W9KVD9_9EURO|nr:uncharacterized protein N7515_009125 [Penicillium bovifimosum]KAJ5121164.1 hypothetical protein N7515_009125 [Penicillium bovifimosum]
MEIISADQPRRGRRSSFSEHIHRVFNKSSDSGALFDSLKKRHSSAFVPPVPFLEREALANEATGDNASYARQSLYVETGPSSISRSSMNSCLPSTGTPGSSLSIAPVGTSENGTPTQQMTPLTTSRPKDRDNICKSPTLDKPKKKEKRVTKRLEAERKELEKRLLALEEAQSKADLGIYERSSRRLTKKQPVSNSSRSSSANAERPRSSSRLSSIFRRSRRNSTSSDLDSQSPEFSQLRNDTNPPSLPLTLPERFGTAITRELQSTHGTALNLSASNRMSNPTQSRSTRSLHAAAKSDDLRENWRMAEAWKTKNDGRQSTRSVSKQISQGSRSIVGNGAQTGETTAATAARGDLDRELFSAALKHDRKSAPATEFVSERVARHDRSIRAISMPVPRSLPQPDPHQPYPNSPTQVTTAHQSQELLPPEAPEDSSSPSSSRSYLPLNPSQTNATGSFARKVRVEQSPRAYKSSPLALNPVKTNESPQKGSMVPEAVAGQNINSPIQSKPPQSSARSHPEDRGRSRLPVAASSGPRQTSSRFMENFHETSQENKAPEVPIKSERRSQENWRIKTPSDESLGEIPVSPFQPAVRSPFHTGSVSPGGRNRRMSRDMSDGNSAVSARSPRRASRASNELPGNILAGGGPGAFVPGHSHAPSHASSHDGHSNHDNDGHSNYDTADEDTPESPELRENSLTRVNTSPLIPPIEAPAAQQPPVSQTMQNNISPGIQPNIQRDTQPSTHSDILAGNQPGISPGSPQTRPAPMSILQRRSEKAKENRPPPISKLFVICCRCKYWHDLPSEVYARLACPERLGPESKLSRALSKKRNGSGSRKLTGSRPLSFGYSASRAQDTPDLHPAPLLPRKVTCCWCGHNMSRSCCEGWTTVVEMRERHH